MTRTRNKRGEGAQLRTDIVRAAARLLDEGTEQNVTLRSVAREAGVSAPSIYSHFADTDACVSPVLSIGEAPAHVHNRVRGTFIERNGVEQAAPAPRFSGTPSLAGEQGSTAIDDALRRWTNTVATAAT